MAPQRFTGSDAVAGVVNFILRDDFEGVELNMSTEQTEKRRCWA